MQRGPSSITLDLHYLSLIPALMEHSVADYPIGSKQLKTAANVAVGQSNIKAVIGAKIILFLKNDQINLKKEFPIYHLSNLDRLFYIVGQSLMTNQYQNQVYQLTKMIANRWFEETSKEDLERILTKLKEQLNIFEKAMQYVNEKEQQKKQLILHALKMFVQILNNSLIKEEDYYTKFKDHGQYIYKNKKYMYFLNILYQIQFLLISKINKQNQLKNPQFLIAYIERKISNFTINRRFSVIIENIAFLIRKLFIIQNKIEISQETYSIFLLQIEEAIDRFFSRIKLSQRTDHYVFHMKYNYFFEYLQNIFDPIAKSQYQMIAKWKNALQKALVQALPQEGRKITNEDIQQAIFFLQLRNRSQFLWSHEQNQQINDFPLIDSKIISKCILNKDLKNKGKQLAQNVVMMIQNGDGDKLYNQSNIIERGIIFYYLHFYENLSFLLKKRITIKAETRKKLLMFRRNMKNEQIIQLLQFYLIDIGLGNSYGLRQDNIKIYNSINNLTYESLIDILYNRLTQYLLDYKEINTTKCLYEIKILFKYFLLLTRAMSQESTTPFLCRNCKNINESILCNNCQYICVGVKLYTSKNPFSECRDQYLLQEMKDKLHFKIKQVYYNIYGEMNASTNEWYYMFACLLQSLIV